MALDWSGVEFGPSSPIEPVAGMLWFDTVSERLFLHTPGGDWVPSVPLPVLSIEHVLTVSLLADQSVAPGWNLLGWDTVVVDVQGGWDNSAKRYTPNVPGFYLFQCLTPITDHFIMMKNGASADHARQIMASRTSPNYFHTNTTVAYMNGTDDFINTWVHQPQATVTPVTYRNELSVYRFVGR